MDYESQNSVLQLPVSQSATGGVEKVPSGEKLRTAHKVERRGKTARAGVKVSFLCSVSLPVRNITCCTRVKHYRHVDAVRAPSRSGAWQGGTVYLYFGRLFPAPDRRPPFDVVISYQTVNMPLSVSDVQHPG